MNNLIQYVLLRNDLNWPKGALIAQACHASIAAISKGLREKDDSTLQYINDFENMTKVVLKVENKSDLVVLSNTLNEKNIKHHLWIEKPDNVPSCLATYPRNKNELKDYFKNFKLFN